MLVWQGAVKDAVENRSRLIAAEAKLSDARAEIEARKQVWALLYGKVGSGAAMSMRRFSNFDADTRTHPLIVDVPNEGRYECSSDGLRCDHK